MRIFAYILKVDSGFAPNPFYGWCTLACCKPAIRRRARAGDWILGITPRGQGNRVAYAMRVDESLSFDEYWSDPRFQAKRPRWRTAAPIVEKCGDNCYEPSSDGAFRQLRSRHWDHERDREDQKQKAKDLSGERVLVGQRFCYYGVNAKPLPADASFRLPERFNRVNFTEQEKAALVPFLNSLPQGIQGQPRKWPTNDSSWETQAPRCG